MANTQFITQEGATAWATVTKTALAAGKLRLTQGLVISAITTKAQLVAAEATFDGYPAGGYALAAWTGPINFSGGGAVITSPLVNPAYGPAGVPPVQNSVNGYWVETAGGDVYIAGNYDPVNPMNIVGDGFPSITQFVIGRNGQQGG